MDRRRFEGFAFPGRRGRSALLASTALAAMVGVGVSALSAPALSQLPTGGVVVGGSVTITQNSSTQLTVNQTTTRGIIDWQTFNVGSGARVDFIQPGQTSVTLNRVIGPDPSTIAGQLNANGQIILINPSGVTFTNGAQVNVHSLIAGTASIGNQAFLAGGAVIFDQASTNANAAVVNDGTITVREGGLIGLVGPNAANNGVINARLGRVTIGGAETMAIDLAGDGLIGLQIGKPTQAATKAANTGTINAPGGTVTISAATARGVVDSIANVQGMVKATTVSIEGGAVVFGGDVDVSSVAAKGGSVNVTGSSVHVQSSARINANGATGGGTVLIGGGKQGAGPLASAQNVNVERGATITASATAEGDGGMVIVWADNTTVFGGEIRARGGAAGGNGGFIETSGKENLSVLTGALVDAGAAQGVAGTWLLDPRSVRIIGGGSSSLTTVSGSGPHDIDPGVVQTALAGANVTIATSAIGDVGDPGNVTVASAISWSAATTLTLLAGNDVVIAGKITGKNGQLAVEAGLITKAGQVTQTTTGAIDVSALSVTTNGGSITLGTATSVPVTILTAGTISAGKAIPDALVASAQLAFSGIASLVRPTGDISLRGSGGTLTLATTDAPNWFGGIVVSTAAHDLWVSFANRTSR